MALRVAAVDLLVSVAIFGFGLFTLLPLFITIGLAALVVALATHVLYKYQMHASFNKKIVAQEQEQAKKKEEEEKKNTQEQEPEETVTEKEEEEEEEEETITQEQEEDIIEQENSLATQQGSNADRFSLLVAGFVREGFKEKGWMPEVLIKMLEAFSSYESICSSVGNSTFLRTTQGLLYVCGENGYGQLGLGHKNHVNKLTPLDLSGKGQIQQIISAGPSTFIWTTKGLYVCGGNKYGQLGLGHKHHVSTLTPLNLSSSI